MRPRRFLLLALAVVGWTAWPPSAVAHEGTGTLALEQAQAVADGEVRYVVRLTWDNDGHAARDATVTATLVAADGTPQTPAPLPPADEDGRYAATLTFPAPGNWTVRFTSVKPQATLEQTATIAAPVTTTTTPTTTTATTEPDGDGGTGNGSSGSSGGSGLLVAGLVVALLAVTALVWAVRRRAASGP